MKAMKKSLIAAMAVAALGFAGTAAASLIDTFDDPFDAPGQRLQVVSGSAQSEYDGTGDVPQSIIGNYRDLYIEYKGDGIAQSVIQVAGGSLRFSNESAAGSIGKVTWDGMGGDGNNALAFGLNANLINQLGCPTSGCTEFIATVLRSDGVFEYQIGVYTDADNYSILTATSLFDIPLPGASVNYVFEWFTRDSGDYNEDGLDFNILQVGTVDFTDVKALQLVINLSGVEDVDLQIDMIGKQAVPEPGTLALAGLALLGVAAARRRVKSAS